MDRLLRFESVIAICALLISAVTGAAVVYQTRIIQNQYAATIWPYLNIDSTFSPSSMKIVLTNDGLGPALIRSAQLTIDGRPVNSWASYYTAFRGQVYIPKGARITSSAASLGASSTIRPGDSHQLLAVTLDPRIPSSIFKLHIMELAICYCSLNDVCWMLRSKPGTDDDRYPQRMSSCPVGPRIM